jgi:hypothetical protein
MADWKRARLIPTSGIDSAREAETRATSAFLAVLSIVRPYSKALLDRLGASRAQNATVDAFIEVEFEWEGKRIRPDGVIRVAHGSRPPWSAVVEVKTGVHPLVAEQVNLYWDIARANGYDAVITISNELAPRLGEHPTPGLKVRSNSPVQICHYSWMYVLTEALLQKRHRGVADPEQAWILGELIRYLQHPSSGAMGFDDMGPSWVTVRDAAREGTLTRRDPGAVEVSSRWIQLIRYTALRLGAEVGEEVQPLWTKRRDVDAAKRITELTTELAQSGQLDGGLRVPNTAGDTLIVADVKAKQLTASVEVEAPQDRGARSRVTWLLNQLTDASPKTIIEAWPRNARAAVATSSLADAREDRSLLCPDNKEAARFRLLLRGEMGLARKAGTKSLGFIDSVSKLLDAFYIGVVQNLKPWRPPAPRVPADNERLSDGMADVEETVSAEILHELGASVVPDPPPSDPEGA